MGNHPDRNAQFENIARLRRECLDAGDPIISIDTKKKDLLRSFYRPGATFTKQTVETTTKRAKASSFRTASMTYLTDTHTSI